MKVFSIFQGFVCDSGHSITIVKALNEKEALEKYRNSLHMSCVPVGVQVTEIEEDVKEVYRYDNPNYEG